MSAAPFFKLTARSAASSIEPRKRTGEAMNFAMAAAPAAFRLRPASTCLRAAGAGPGKSLCTRPRGHLGPCRHMPAHMIELAS